LKGHFLGCDMTHMRLLFPLPDPIPQAQCLLFISSDNVCTECLDKNVIVSSLPTCEGILLLQGFSE